MPLPMNKLGYTLLQGGWFKDEDGSGPYVHDGASGFVLIGEISNDAGSPVPVSEQLATPTTAHQLAAGAASDNVQITGSAVSLYANGSDIRYEIGDDNTVVADAITGHFLAQGERIDLHIPAGHYIAAIRAGSVDGVLEISELA